MNAASIRPGDMVEVDKKGRRFFAIVVSRGQVTNIRPVDRKVTYRHCTSREIVGIWKANARTRARYAPEREAVTV